MEYTTQMDAARKGIATPQMKAVAEKEHMPLEQLMELVAKGQVAICANKAHTCLDPQGVGSMLRTKINVNLGVSRDCKDYDIEMKKVQSAIDLGAEAIMDLSSHGDTQPFRKKLVAECPAMIGTVPVYDSVIHYQRDLGTLSAQDFIDVVRLHAEDGVDFVTLHCGITRKTIDQIRTHKRKMNIVSRGGSLVFAGAMGFGTLAAFISYTTQLFDPIQQLARILAEMQSAQASAERVIDLLDTQPDIVDSPEVEAEYGTAFAPRRGNWPPIAGGVEFRDVTFAYKTGETVLRDFNLKVEPGQTIALVGETGAGKSTIVNLVCRFYEPTAGQVLIDGVDYRERSQLWLHSALGYVLQTPHLFSGSIADNIRYGRKDATLDEVKRAAAMVRADRFIEALPDGYGTEVGEGGGRLSTGQKQLVCFARVVLSDPRIFVLDEATSSIDTETEQLIQNAIQTVLTGRTSFIVAHRLSTIRSADKILVIRGGRITEAGTHDELLALGGYYYSLYTHQYRAEATRNAFEA